MFECRLTCAKLPLARTCTPPAVPRLYAFGDGFAIRRYHRTRHTHDTHTHHTHRTYYHLEFAWELDPHLARRLRGQRTTIRLECFLVDVHHKRQSLGFLVLDLRGAERLPATQSYRRLAGGGVGGVVKPELKMAFGMGDAVPMRTFDDDDDDDDAEAEAVMNAHLNAVTTPRTDVPLTWDEPSPLALNRLPSLPTTDDDSPWHQFRFGIDIKSVRNIQLQSSNIYFAYNYNPTGTRSPVYTYPPVTVNKPTREALLPNSFCAFEFVLHPRRVRAYLMGYPLQLELWHRDQYERDARIGLLTVDIGPLTTAPKRWVDNASSTGGRVVRTLMRTHDQYYYVKWAPEARAVLPDAVNKSPRFVTEVRVIMALEDFGPLEGGGPDDNSSVDMADLDVEERRRELALGDDEDDVAPVRAESRDVVEVNMASEHEDVVNMKASDAERENVVEMKTIAGPTPKEQVTERTKGTAVIAVTTPNASSAATAAALPMAGPAPRHHVPPTEVRFEESAASTATTSRLDEQTIAVQQELQLWRHDEEVTFIKRLRTVEADMERRLVRLWDRKHEDADQRTKLRLLELDAVHDKVNKFVEELSGREQKVNRAFIALRQKRDAGAADNKQRVAEIELALERLKTEAEHSVKAEKKNSALVAKEVATLKAEHRAVEDRLTKLRAEFDEAQRPVEPENQPAIDELTEKKEFLATDLTRLCEKLTAARAAKIKAKSNLAKLLSKLNDLKRQQMATEEERLARERAKLEEVRARALFTREQEELKADRDVLRSIRVEVENLQNRMSAARSVGSGTAAFRGNGETLGFDQHVDDGVGRENGHRGMAADVVSEDEASVISGRSHDVMPRHVVIVLTYSFHSFADYHSSHHQPSMPNPDSSSTKTLVQNSPEKSIVW